MPEKVLFHYDQDREFMHIQNVPKPSKPYHDGEVLRRRLINYAATHPDHKIREACKVLVDSIDVRDIYRYTDSFDIWQVKALQGAIQLKMGGDERSTLEIIAQLEELIKKGEIW
jgi:hypothetical protein